MSLLIEIFKAIQSGDWSTVGQVAKVFVFIFGCMGALFLARKAAGYVDKAWRKIFRRSLSLKKPEDDLPDSEACIWLVLVLTTVAALSYVFWW